MGSLHCQGAVRQAFETASTASIHSSTTLPYSQSDTSREDRRVVEESLQKPCFSHSKSDTSAEADRKQKRLAINREASRRLRRRYSDRVAELQGTVAGLHQEQAEAFEKLERAHERIEELQQRNRALLEGATGVLPRQNCLGLGLTD